MAIKKKPELKKNTAKPKAKTASAKLVIKAKPVKSAVKSVAPKKSVVKPQVKKSATPKNKTPVVIEKKTSKGKAVPQKPIKKVVKNVPVKSVTTTKSKLQPKPKAQVKKAVAPVKKSVKPVKIETKKKVQKVVIDNKPKKIDKKPVKKIEPIKKVTKPTAKTEVVKDTSSKKPFLKEKPKQNKVTTKPVESPKVASKHVVKYPDADLEVFRNRIIELKKEAMEELSMLKDRLDDLNNYDFAEESMIYSMHMAEQGSEAMEKEKTYAQIQRINEYIKKLDEALERIKLKTYGVCRVCNCLIAKERLMAVPITTLSASYKIHKKCPEDGVDRIEPLNNK